MDFNDPAALLSGIFIGLIGTAMFIYGKKQQRPPCLIGGAVLCIFPMVITSLLAMWLVAAACIGGVIFCERAA